jgi:hypothetical protein
MLLAACALLTGGCAAGAWLESPSDADLPLDRPVRGYPTAIRASLSDDPPSDSAASPEMAAVQSSSSPQHANAPTPAFDPTATAGQQAVQRIQPPTQAAHQRFDRTPPQTPLAVVPPQYVQSTTTPASGVAPNQVTQSPPVMDFAPLASLPAAGISAVDTAYPIVAPQPSAAPVSIFTASTTTSTAATSSSGTAAASYQQPDSPAEQQVRIEHALGQLIDALETEIRSRRSQIASDDELPRLEQQLRLAYAAANRMDEAVASVDSLDAAQREAFKHLMFGLGVWMSPDESRRAALRSAKVLHSLREATTELATASKLEVRNVAFCERVDNFGWYTEFPRREFQPKQQVILYAEIENFSADQKGPAGYETELQGSYEIFDASGQLITSRQLPSDKEVCRNYRRDYFLAYKIYLPDELSPGRYRLELTVEDLKARGKYPGRKLGEGIIEFTIR